MIKYKPLKLKKLSLKFWRQVLITFNVPSIPALNCSGSAFIFYKVLIENYSLSHKPCFVQIGRVVFYYIWLGEPAGIVIYGYDTTGLKRIAEASNIFLGLE